MSFDSVKIAAVLLAALSSLAIYASSVHQRLFSVAISKWLAGLLFVVASLASVYLFMQVFTVPGAIFFWLLVLMVVLLLLSLVVPHFKNPTKTLLGGALVMLLIGLI